MAGPEPPGRIGRPTGPGSLRQTLAEYDAAVVKHGEVARAVAAAAGEAGQVRSRLAAAVRALAKPQPAPHDDVPIAEVVEEPEDVPPTAVEAPALQPRRPEGGAAPAYASPEQNVHQGGRLTSQPARAAAEKPAESAVPPPADDELQAEEQAIAETVATGRQVLDDLDRCVHLVEDVARGGKWHLVTSAISSKSSDHAKIDEARLAAHEVLENLRRFNGQMADLRRRFGGRLGHGDAATLADRFLGSLIGEGHGDAAPCALESAHEAYHEVRALCARLQLEASAARARRAARERRQVAQAR